ncbi:MAG: DUF126 domain-containing protein [Chloroflexota bacterium]
MKRLFADPLVPGEGRGPVLILEEPLSLWGGLDPETGEIIDRRHPNSGQCVTNAVLLMPGSRGSSSASSILLEAIRAGTAPAAIVIKERDGLLALGAAVAQEMYGQTPPVVVLDSKAYSTIGKGDILHVHAQNEEAYVAIAC